MLVKDELIYCACGCGKIIDKYDKENRERKYSKGHKGRLMQIRTDKKEINNLIDLYINQKKNAPEIAKIYNCSDVTILNVLRRNGIKIRTSGESLKGVRKGIKQTKKHIENRTKAVIESYNKYPELRKLRGEAIKRNIWNNPEKKERVIKKTIETRKRLFKEGKLKSWNKNKTHLDDPRILGGKNHHYYNKKRPREAMERMAQTKRRKYASGETKSWSKGLTKETDERLKKSGEKISKNKIRYFKENPLAKLRMKKQRAKQILPKRDSLIEIKIQNFLKQLNIEFFTHQYMKIPHGYQCDIYIPSKNLIIECDGEFIHCNPLKYSSDFVRFPNYKKITTAQEIWDRDKIRTKELQEAGFKVLRLWEHEIKVMKIEDFQNKLNQIQDPIEYFLK